MKTENHIVIHAPAERIFALAADTAQWATILPHYRYVRVLERNEQRQTVAMGARRNWIPVRWTAQQINNPQIPEIRFTHIRGWTKGMDVVWRFIPEGSATRVVIEHTLTFRFPLLGGWIGRVIIGGFFVEYIANKTLNRIKFLAESAV